MNGSEGRVENAKDDGADWAKEKQNKNDLLNLFERHSLNYNQLINFEYDMNIHYY